MITSLVVTGMGKIGRALVEALSALARTTATGWSRIADLGGRFAGAPCWRASRRPRRVLKEAGSHPGTDPVQCQVNLDLRSGHGGAVELQVGIERGAEAMDEGHGTEAGLRGCTGATGP
jgi:hypothetical protein